MKLSKVIFLMGLFYISAAGAALANQRLFTYSYEPETMPQGAREFEQHVTLRTPRTAAVGKDDYVRWDIREELEYGITDHWTLGLYLNLKDERFRNSAGAKKHEFEFNGVSIENRWMIANPVNHPVGLALYLEPTFAEDETKLEEKIILGRRQGDWKWALNVSHETEWEDGRTEGEIEVTFGAARPLNKRWSLGVEFRNQNAIEEYEEWERSVFFLGPVVSYRRENWWAALTVLGQVYGKDHGTDKDGKSSLSLKDNETVNARLIIGIDF
jgi:hypothetical protein